MANPIYSTVVYLDQVPHFTSDSDSDSGTSQGIPIIASVSRTESEEFNGYLIEFNIPAMEKAAAEAMNVDVSLVTTEYGKGKLRIFATGGDDPVDPGV